MSEQDDVAVDLKLLSNFIHQVINPLNGVIGTLDNIIDGTVPAERRDQRLQAVRAQLEWTVLLVRNLAYFAGTTLTPGAPQGTDTTKTCVIPQLIIEAAQFFQELASSKGIEVKLMDRRTQYAVTGSPDLLRQVFMNLIDNSVKYSDLGTPVEITPWVQKKTKSLILEVRNIGVGFKSAEANKLFEIGYRGEDARTLVPSGTGLGLYICRRIIEDVHGGGIEAEYSPRARETTIRLRFPNWRYA
jgi:signal transduction histidine kinase